MSAARTVPRAVLARAISVLLPVVALVALVLIGRRSRIAAADAAEPSPSPVVASSAGASPSPDAAVIDAGPAQDASEPLEADAAVAQGSATDASASIVLADGAVVLDLNRATEADLRRLPGIGPSRARAILELRKRLGRFKSVADLARVKGIGRSTLKRLRPLTTVGT